MFDSIYSAAVTPAQFFLMAAAALLSGLLYSWIMSFRVGSTKRFFTVCALIPFVVAAVITFVNGNIGAGVAIGGAFGLIRVRSAQGSADEIAGILIAMASGIAFGMGYLGYGILILIGLALLYYLLSLAPIFEHSALGADRLLRITIPEALEYNGVFDEPFRRFLRCCEPAGVKTTGMGSMFRLSYRVQLRNPAEEKAFLDALRERNGNLEIALLPYTEKQNQL